MTKIKSAAYPGAPDVEFVECCLCGQRYITLKAIYEEGNLLALSKCKDCGLIFFSKRLSQKYIASLYKKDEFFQSVTNNTYTEDDIQDFTKRIELAKPHLFTEVNLLDVGCSTGTFMKTAKTILRPKILHGIDLNEITNKHCREKG